MAKHCFICNAKIGIFDESYNLTKFKTLTKDKVPPPDNMTYQDHICLKCFGKYRLTEDETKTLKSQEKAKQKEFLARVPDYERKWKKGGVIEYKDDHCAILNRPWGAQVQFIIAFSDLTKEGYRLMAQDEGKTASAGPFSGGISSTYYFQKFPRNGG